MGCDIHSIGQVKKKGKWKTKLVRVAGDSRSYHSFAVMADVRNGRGFAGCKTGDTWEPISEPRDLPEDIEDMVDSENIKVPLYRSYGRDSDTAWLGEHSHSYLGLDEINQKLKELEGSDYTVEGIVSRKHWNEIKHTGFIPREWCGGVGGGVVVSEKEVLEGVRKWDYVQMSWKVPALEMLGYLIKVAEELNKLAKNEGVSEDQVRIVFGFDS